MDATPTPSDNQTTLWNGASGRAWVEAQQLLDRVFKPLELQLVEAVSLDGRGPVLDVGCGTGSTTLAAARVLEARGGVTGIDISEPMLLAATARAQLEKSAATFLQGDAEDHPFELKSFAQIISRFGVMFFNDPVRAFANLRRAAKGDAQLRFVAWRSVAENPFMTTAERAAAPFLPNLPIRRPDSPGQFAFADDRRVARILEQSGWDDIDIRPIDPMCTLREDELIAYITKLGPVGLHLQEADDRTRAQIMESIRPAFAPYVHGAEVRFQAACWVVGARATSIS